MNRKQFLHSGLTRRELLKYSIYGSLAAGIFPGFWLGGCGKKKRPNIILITLDTTRADHLGCYGYHRQTSPNLDKLAAESVLYTKAVAPASWTLPSHTSLFTGKFTSSHGVQYDPDGPLQLTSPLRSLEELRGYRARGLAQNETTLAEKLKKAGYSTGAIVAGPWLNKIFGLDKGFDYYDDREIAPIKGRLASQVTNTALKWIQEKQGKEFFLFLNYFDPHAPYDPPEGFYCSFLSLSKANELLQGKKSTTEEDIALYDGEILYMDHYIAKLLEKLKTDNLYEETMIIVTADHGEMFGEHGSFGHGNYLFQEEIHVPLFIKYPGTDVPPARTDSPIQLNDLMAIIFDYLDIRMPKDVQAGIPPKIGHPLLAETYPLPILSQDGHWRAIFDEDFKFMWNSKGNHMLFDIKNDPQEQKNFAAVNPERKNKMLSDLNRYLAKLPEPGPATDGKELDENTKKALKSLGYVE